MILNRPHPEKKAGEVFLTNSTARNYPLIPWKSKRRGEIPLDKHGTPISGGIYFPVFVLRSELEQAGLKVSNE